MTHNRLKLHVLRPLFVAVATACVLSPSTAQPPPPPAPCRNTPAPPDYGYPGGFGQYGVPPTGNCNVPTFKSQCWFGEYQMTSLGNAPYLFTPGGADEWQGFRLNAQLATCLGPGDYGPRDSSFEGSSFPLIPRSEAGLAAGASPAFPARPVLAGQVDLITGSPLVQATDLELPFGSALFRHTRTLADHLPSMASWGSSSSGSGLNDLLWRTFPRERDLLWDWNGTGWMMSEAPILLIDASLPGTNSVGVLASQPSEKQRVSYFVLDAHHKIPFKLATQGTNFGTYEADRRHGAIMTQDGGSWMPPPTNNPAYPEGYWATPPQRYTVWLNNGALKYTFDKVYFQDVPHSFASRAIDPPDALVDEHALPQTTGTPPYSNGGHGTPFYALPTQIDDRYGNRIKLYYCEQRQFAMDDPSTSGCRECGQNCNEKGQLTKVELISHADTPQQQIEWTLLYVYRGFTSTPPPSPLDSAPPTLRGAWNRNTHRIDDVPRTDVPTDRQIQELRQQHALVALYAYRGSPNVSPTCWTLSADIFENSLTLEDIDSIDPTYLLGLPTNWVQCARYTYSEGYTFFNAHTSQLTPQVTAYMSEYAPSLDEPAGESWYSNGEEPRLLKASVFKKRSPTDASPSVAHTLYRYSQYHFMGLDEESTSYWPLPKLTAVFGPSTVSRIVASLPPGPGGRSANVNDVIRLPNSATVANGAGGTGSLLKAADSSFRRIADRSFVTPYDFNESYRAAAEFSSSKVHREIMQLLARPAQSVLWDPFGVHVFEGKDESGTRGLYRLYRFMLFDPADPQGMPALVGSPQPASHAYAFNTTTISGVGSELINGLFRGRFDQPYRQVYFDEMPTNRGIMARTVPATEPMWATVIDRLRIPQDADYYKYTSDESHYTYPLSRRIVMMNSAGAILREKTYTFPSGGPGTIAASSGIAEEYAYDQFGRLSERRSKGWSTLSETGSDPESDHAGLIWVYQYDDPPNATASTAAKHVALEGIKKGERGQPFWLRSYEMHPQRTDVVTKYVEFNTPTTSRTPRLTDSITSTYLQLEPVAGGAPGGDQRITRKVEVGPPTPHRPGGPLLYPIKKELYDAGRLTWKAHGYLANALSPSADNPVPAGADDRMWVDYSGYDPSGRLQVSVVDAVPGQSGVPVAPDAGFVHAAPDVPALQYKSTYTYSEFGLATATFPVNRTTYYFYNILGDGDTIEQRVCGDVTESAGVYKALTAAIRTVFDANMRPISKDRGHVDFNGVPTGLENFVVDVSETIAYDGQGQPASVATTSASGGTDASYFEYDDFGGVRREQTPSGTITRYSVDQLGRVERVYRGSTDKNPYWGTLPPGGTPIDDLALMEVRKYGSGVSDAHQLVERVQYFRGLIALYPPDSLATESASGRSEQYLYDWRMRRVATRRPSLRGASGTFDFEVQWLDQLGRVILEASYEAVAALPASVDPANSDSGPQSLVPQAGAVANATPHPSALTEHVLSLSGETTETRRYNLDQGTDYGTYIAARTYTDDAARVVYQDSSDSGVVQNIYDAIGRKVVRSMWAGSAEVERMESIFDPLNNEVETQTFERVHAAPAAGIAGAQNTVRSRRLRWYDEDHRVVAEADLGSDNSSNVFVTGGTPTARPNADPRLFGADGNLSDADRSVLGSNALITCYQFDDRGRVKRMLRPDGTIEAYTHDDRGNISAQTLLFNHPPAPQQSRTTAFIYERGRLTHTGGLAIGQSLANWQSTPGAAQCTKVVYGADVYDDDAAMSSQVKVSRNLDLVGAIHYPDPFSGIARATPDYTYGYYRDGKLAWRKDGRGIVLRYFYDANRSLTRTVVDESTFQTQLPTGTVLAPDRIRRVDAGYDASGRLLRVSAWTSPTIATGQLPIADSQFLYSSFGLLTREMQEHGAALGPNSPAVDYQWQYRSADATGTGIRPNTLRVGSITYPTRLGTNTRRVVTFGYGLAQSGMQSPGPADDALDRVTSITDSVLGPVAGYSYSGALRRVETTWGGDGSSLAFAARQSLASSGGVVGYDRLDAHGRVADQLILRANGNTIHRYQYGYDAAGRLRYSRATQATIVLPHSNDRSFLFGYDCFDRLSSANWGPLDPGNAGMGSPTRSITWVPDEFGDWAGGLQGLLGKLVVGQLDSNPGIDQLQTGHVHDRRNQITQLYTSFNAINQSAYPAYDACGNMVFDGTYIYQYDAWNRLIQVRARGSVTQFDPVTGAPSAGVIGPWIVQYTYDGVGRQIRKLSPWPTVANKQRIEHYYYDGLRRIQEVFTDPLQLNDEGGNAGTGESEGTPIAAVQEVGAANAQTQAESGTTQPVIQQIIQIQTTTTYTSREYIYSPSTLDEIVCQIDQNGTPLYVLYDVSGNVVGLIDASGNVREQYSYDPYGELLAADRVGPETGSRLAYKGMWFDRLDAGIDTPTLAVGSAGLYQVRNRSYLPALGRFAQADPLGLGQCVLGDAGWRNGTTPSPLKARLDLSAHYRDGTNHFALTSGTPLLRADPLGLLGVADPIPQIPSLTTAVYAPYAPGIAMGLLQRGLMAAAGEGAWAIAARSGIGGGLFVMMNWPAVLDAIQNAKHRNYHAENNEGAGGGGGGGGGGGDNNFSGYSDFDPDGFTPAGRQLGEHVRDYMEDRGIDANMIDECIDTGKRVMQSNGRWNIYSKKLDITVIFSEAENFVVSAMNGRSAPF